jgi:hypothetical protein
VGGIDRLGRWHDPRDPSARDPRHRFASGSKRPGRSLD